MGHRLMVKSTGFGPVDGGSIPSGPAILAHDKRWYKAKAKEAKQKPSCSPSSLPLRGGASWLTGSVVESAIALCRDSRWKARKWAIAPRHKWRLAKETERAYIRAWLQRIWLGQIGQIYGVRVIRSIDVTTTI